MGLGPPGLDYAVPVGAVDPARSAADRVGHAAGPERDLMELNCWTAPQMLRRYGTSARSARARLTYNRIMTDTRHHHQRPQQHWARCLADVKGSPSP
jgi:hypothetical protein